MQAGKYYVGDLCYVMSDDEWSEVCSITIKGNQCIEGEFEFKDGRKFAMYSTAWGDGEYQDQYGNCYGVDSGTIGCILADDIKYIGVEPIELHTFATDFVTAGKKENDGIIQFGHVIIETNPTYEE